MRKEGGFFEGSGSITFGLRFYTTSIPTGLQLFQEGGAGLIGTVARILVVEVPEDMQPGIYTLEIGIEIEEKDWSGEVPRTIDKKDYGTLPCTIEVIEPTT